MSYDLVKNGIVDILQAQGYQESQYSNIEECPSQELDKTFIISAVSGENNERSSETLSLLYDNQKWVVVIGFEQSSQSQNIVGDTVNRARDILIKEFDDPANWQSYVRIQKYLNWKIEDKKSYITLTIELKIVDTIVY